MNTTNKTPAEFEEALARFLKLTQEHVTAYFAANFPRLTVPTVETSPGGLKYVRVVIRENGASAFCFVERATGNVLKCDGWKRPAKGVRGSIYAETFEGFGVSSYGANYAR